MEIKITQSAAEELKKKLEGKDQTLGVRIFIAGIGWGGPSYGLALDEQKKTDNVYEVEGIKVLFDKELSRYSKGFVIDYRNSFFGKRFIVEQLYGRSGCSCWYKRSWLKARILKPRPLEFKQIVFNFLK